MEESTPELEQLTTFLGFVNYYRSFIVNYSEMMAPLTKQKKQKKLNWDADCEKGFKMVKVQFGKAPIRAAPVYDGRYPFTLTTDYSGIAIAAVLSQEQQG